MLAYVLVCSHAANLRAFVCSCDLCACVLACLHACMFSVHAVLRLRACLLDCMLSGFHVRLRACLNTSPRVCLCSCVLACLPACARARWRACVLSCLDACELACLSAYGACMHGLPALHACDAAYLDACMLARKHAQACLCDGLLGCAHACVHVGCACVHMCWRAGLHPWMRACVCAMRACALACTKIPRARPTGRGPASRSLGGALKRKCCPDLLTAQDHCTG